MIFSLLDYVRKNRETWVTLNLVTDCIGYFPRWGLNQILGKQSLNFEICLFCSLIIRLLQAYPAALQLDVNHVKREASLRFTLFYLPNDFFKCCPWDLDLPCAAQVIAFTLKFLICKIIFYIAMKYMHLIIMIRIN